LHLVLINNGSVESCLLGTLLACRTAKNGMPIARRLQQRSLQLSCKVAGPRDAHRGAPLRP
jgi:hypothetical protein